MWKTTIPKIVLFIEHLYCEKVVIKNASKIFEAFLLDFLLVLSWWDLCIEIEIDSTKRIYELCISV